MIIDIFTHHISRRVGKIINREKYFGKGKQFDYPVENADVETRLQLMDKCGIDMQVLSQTAPVLLGFNADEAAEICRLSNDDNFALCKAYPEKFANICIFSLLDVKNTIKELDRSVSELDCRGITLATNQNGKGLDSPEYLPFYDKVARYDLPILLHPTHWESYPLMDMEMMAAFGWPFDTTQAVWRLIFGQVLDHYPALKIVTHHCGGLLAFYLRRIENRSKKPATRLNRKLSEYWKNIYGDCIIAPSAIDCGYNFFGSERLLFGTDYPFASEEGVKERLNIVKTMNISEEEKYKILGENAQKLLKIK